MQVTCCFDTGGTKIVVADIAENVDIVEVKRLPTTILSAFEVVDTLQIPYNISKEPIGVSIARAFLSYKELIKDINVPYHQAQINP